MGRPANVLRELLIPLAVSVLLVLAPLSVSHGEEIYKYMDKDGVLHYTNTPVDTGAKKILSAPVSIFWHPNKTFTRAPLIRPLYPSSYASSCAPLKPTTFDPHIRLTCQRYGLDQNLVKAVIKAESGFDPQAVSPKGAMGLMQLMPGTSSDMGVMDPLNPHENIEGGARYLKMLLTRFNNDIVLALAAYNAGPEAVQKYGGIPPYDETQTYVQRVLDFYSRYAK